MFKLCIGSFADKNIQRQGKPAASYWSRLLVTIIQFYSKMLWLRQGIFVCKLSKVPRLVGVQCNYSYSLKFQNDMQQGIKKKKNSLVLREARICLSHSSNVLNKYEDKKSFYRSIFLSYYLTKGLLESLIICLLKKLSKIKKKTNWKNVCRKEFYLCVNRQL